MIPHMVRQRWRFGPWKTYALSWARLKNEVAKVVAVDVTEQETNK